MNYEFPFITNIKDVLPAIDERDEFVVADKGDYTIINYNVVMSDTFPQIIPKFLEAGHEQDFYASLRRECRGITFCSKTGDILRRPYGKFFNIGERAETQPEMIDLSQDHYILDKLDGSMIAPFRLSDGKLIWATKMAAPDFHDMVEVFVQKNPRYIKFAHAMIDAGYTPIWEWCSRKTRIVVDHPEDTMILTAVRHITDGDYMTYGNMDSYAYQYDIPVVSRYSSATDIHKFIADTKDLQDVEGYVVRFRDGHMVKMKCDWYVAIHKAKEAILWDRNIVEMILDEKLDDIKGHLPPEDRVRLDEFESKLNRAIIDHSLSMFYATNVEKAVGDRKHFALGAASRYSAPSKSIIFSLWDDNSEERALELVRATVRKNIGSNTNWNDLASKWFNGIKYNT